MSSTDLSYLKKWLLRNLVLLCAAALYLLPLLTIHLPLSDIQSGTAGSAFIFILPVGLGLLVLPNMKGFFSRATQLSLAYFVGLLMLVLIYMEREASIWFLPRADHLFSVLSALSMGGLLKHRDNLLLDGEFRQTFRIFLLVAAPIFALRYILHFGVLSQYPLTDIFQFTHQMKGAMEFARFDLLNRFTADSYIPVWQVLGGFAYRYFNADLLMIYWVYPVFATILSFWVNWSLATSFASTKEQRTIFIAIATVFSAISIPTNGTLGAYGATLLLSIVSRRSSEGQASQWPLLSAGIGFVTGWLMRPVPPGLYLIIMLSAFLLLVYFGGRWRYAAHVKSSAVALLLVLCILPLHRSSLLFIPIVLCCAIFLAYTWRKIVGEGSGGMWNKVLLGVSVVLPILALTEASIILMQKWNGVADSFYLSKLFNIVLQNMIGVSINSDVALGAGGEIALFEIGRVVSPILILLIAGAYYFLFTRSETFLSNNKTTSSFTGDRVYFLGMWNFAWFIISLALLGFPFAHRAMFIPILLLSIALAIILMELMHNEGMRFSVLFVLAVIASYTALAIVAVFAVHKGYLGEHSEYLNALMPIIAFVAAAIVGGVMVMMILLALKGSLAYASIIIPVFIIVSMIWEKETLGLYFYVKSYGHPPGGKITISHYTGTDLEIAESILKKHPKTVMISDPLTLAILRARTGNNSIITFSNLGTFSPEVELDLRSLLKAVVEQEGKGQSRLCERITDLLGQGSSAEFNYSTLRRFSYGVNTLKGLGYGSSVALKQTQAPREAEPATDSSKSKHEFVSILEKIMGFHFTVIVNDSTVRWLNNAPGTPVSYFSSGNALRKELVERLMVYPEAVDFGGHAVVFPIVCRK